MQFFLMVFWKLCFSSQLHFFASNQDHASALKVAFILEGFLAQSCLVVA